MNFKKTVLFFLLMGLTLSFPRPSFGLEPYEKKLIKNVQISGYPLHTQHNRPELLTKQGQRLIAEFLEKDSKTLYKTGILESVSVSVIPTANQVSVIFICVSYPKIKKIIIQGNEKVSKKKYQSLMKNKSGNILNIALLQKDKNKIELYYKEKGYELFQINKMEMDPSNNIILEVNEGKIESISFIGLEKIKAEIIIKNLNSKKGKPFNTETLRRDRERLLRLGYFSEIPSPILKDGKTPNSVEITFQVKEKKSNRIDVGLEQEQEKFVGFTKLIKNHSLIPGDLFTGKVQLGTLNTNKVGINSYSVHYSQPWLLNKYPISIGLDFWEDLKEEIAPNQFHKGQLVTESTDRIGEALTIGIPFNQDLLNLQTKIKNENISPREGSTFSKYYIHSISALLSYKNTNSLFNPKSGNYGKIEYEKGGNLGLIDIKGINFYRITINGAHFIKLNEKSVIGMHSSMGIFQTQDTSTFDTESFVIGGVNSVRGYNENDFPFHGTRKITYNLEYRQDLTKNTQWVAFLDAGKTFETGWSLTNDFHFGKGVGVRFFTPVGPIRLDYARGEQDYFIHLGLGQLF